jgi:hypothetical protein
MTILPSVPRSPMWSFPFRFSGLNFLSIFHLSNSRYLTACLLYTYCEM